MFESKRNSNRQKKLPSRQKKYSYGLEDFVRVFGKLTTPYVMFESKKTQILIEFLDGTKKVQLVGKKSFLVGKKVPLGFRGFCTYFWEVDHPLCDEFLDGTKKVQLAGKKSFLVAKKSSPRV